VAGKGKTGKGKCSRERDTVRRKKLLLDVPVCPSREMWGISQKNQLPRNQ
jgi:hypothetical protein